MTPTQVLKKLEDIARDADDREYNLAAWVQHNMVKPFCDEHDLQFGAVNGDWWFMKAGSIYLNIYNNDGKMYNDLVPKPLLMLLNAQLHNTRDVLGSIMETYTSPGYKP